MARKSVQRAEELDGPSGTELKSLRGRLAALEAEIARGKAREADLEAEVENAIVLNVGLCEQFGIGFAVENSVPDAFVEGDTDRNVQVLTNFLANAAKYPPPEGVVEVSCARAGDSVRLTVRDSGPGIAEKFECLVFDRFQGCSWNWAWPLHQQIDYRPPRWCYRIRSRTGRGAAFFFELPILSNSGSNQD